MNFFRKLQTEGLRRLVKVVLNRTIGPFLETQIELEQLEMEAETGLFHIRDVPLNCALLNELLVGSSIGIAAASVAELAVTISWAAVNDGCKITLDGVHLTLCRRSSSAEAAAAPTEPSESVAPTSPGSSGSDSFEEEGVMFLANWIDIVVSRFHVELKDIQIHLSGGDDSSTPAVRFSIEEMHYYNSKPESSGGRGGIAPGSVVNSVSMASQSVSRAQGRGQPAVASVMLLSSQEAHSSKLLSFSGFRVDLVSSEALGPDSVTSNGDPDDGSDSEAGRSEGSESEIKIRYHSALLRSDGSGRVLIRSVSSRVSQAASTDINITLPAISSYINVKYITTLNAILSSIGTADESPDVPPQSKASEGSVIGAGLYGVQDKFRAVTIERTMKILEGLGEDKDIKSSSSEAAGVDMAKVARMLKTYQSIRHKLESEEGGDLSLSSSLPSEAFYSAVGPTESYRGFESTALDARHGAVDSSIVTVVSEDDEEVLSEGDVDVSSVEEDSDEDFFDAEQGQGMSRVEARKSNRGVGPTKESVQSPARSARPVRATGATATCGISVRFIVPSFDLTIAQGFPAECSDSHSVNLSLCDLHATLRVPVLCAPGEPAPPTMFTLRVHSMALTETTLLASRPEIFPVIYFGEFVNTEAKGVFPPCKSTADKAVPRGGGISITEDVDLDLRIEFSNKQQSEHSQQSDVNLSVKLNPLVLFISPSMIIRWATEMSPLIPSGSAESGSQVSLVADLPCVNVVLCPVATPTEFPRRPLPIDALRMLRVLNEGDNTINTALEYNRWMARDVGVTEHARRALVRLRRRGEEGSRLAQNPFVRNPFDVFFRIALHRVRLRVQSPSTRDHTAGEWRIPAPLVEMHELSAYLRLEISIASKKQNINALGENGPLRIAAHELKFISSLSSADRKISVRQFSESDFSKDSSKSDGVNLPSILRSRMSRKEHLRSHDKASGRSSVQYSETNETNGKISGGGIAAEKKPPELRASSIEEGPLPPALHGGDIFAIDAHLIRLDLQSREYSLFIGLIDFFVPPSSVGSAGTDRRGIRSDLSGVMPKGIGVKLTAEIFLCSLSQDEYRKPSAPSVGKNKSSQPQVQEDRCTYVLSTREPLIEFYSSHSRKDESDSLESQVYIGLEVENVSAFEFTDEQMKDPLCGQGLSTIGVRVGPGSYNIPIVHVTTFARDWMQQNEPKSPSKANQSIMGSVLGEGTDPTSGPAGRKWTLSVGALITEDKELNSINTLLHIDFQDVTVRYDPLSRWLQNVIDIVTPQTLKELMPCYESGVTVMPHETDVSSGADYTGSTDFSSPLEFRPPLETLHLRVSVRQALLDYCAINRPIENADGIVISPGTPIDGTGPIAAPRVLMSLGMMTVGTTFVSTSHQFGLKIGVSDISLRLTNSILRDNRFELVPLDVNGVISTYGLAAQLRARGKSDFRPCCRYFEDFIDVHSFVRMGKIRNMQLMLRLNGGVKRARDGQEVDDESERIDVAATVDDVYCCGCADSLNVFADTINTLVADLKDAAEYELPQAPTPRAGGTAVTPRQQSADHIQSSTTEYSSSEPTSDEDEDMFTEHRRESSSSKHSSHDDLHAAGLAVASPAGRVVLRPVLHTSHKNHMMHTGNVHHLTRDSGVEPDKKALNLLSGIDRDMFAPKASEEDSNSRMSTRSASSSVLMEAIYDDDYYVEDAPEPVGPGAGESDLGDLGIQFKRSEKLASAGSHQPNDDLTYIKNRSNPKKKSLFNSEFDAETEAIFLADLQDEESVDDDDESVSSENGFYVSSSKAAGNRTQEHSQWSLFLGKKDAPEDEELASLPEITSPAVEEETLSMRHCKSEGSLVAPPSPVAPWKASAAAGTDEGVNLAAYTEEETVLQGEDTFVVVDYSDPSDTTRPEVKWFDGQETLATSRVNPHHIPVLVSAEEAEEMESVSPKILVKVALSVKFQLLHGRDWSTHQDSSSAILRKQLLKKGGAVSNNSDSSGHANAVGAKGSTRKSGHRVLFADDIEGMKQKQPIASKTHQDHAESIVMNKDRAELCLSGVNVRFAMYAPDEETIAHWPVQRTIVKVNDIDVKFYRKNHRVKKVVGYWKSHVPRELNAPMLHVHLDTFVDTVCKSHHREEENDQDRVEAKKHQDKTDIAGLAIGRDIEHVNKISIVLLPLSCHLDAPFLDLVRNLGESFKPGPEETNKDSKGGADKEGGAGNEGGAVPEQLTSVPASIALNQLDRERPLFFQQWKMSPISLKIYYEPRAFDIVKFQKGDYIEILNCFPLEGLEISMKKTLLYGVVGVQGGIDNTLRIWVDEIRDNQLSNIAKVLSGVAPLKGVASIGKGLHHNLFVMPRREFNRRGTSGALQSVAGGVAAVGGTVFREALHAGAQATQMLANLLNRVADPLVEEHTAPHRRKYSSRHAGKLVDSQRRPHTSSRVVGNAPQPRGMAEGGQLAYDALSTSLASAVDNIVLVPIREYNRTGSGGVISSVIRAVPIAVLGPAAGAAQAVSYTFLGMRNQVDPSRRRDEEAVYVDIEKSEQGLSGYRG